MLMHRLLLLYLVHAQVCLPSEKDPEVVNTVSELEDVLPDIENRFWGSNGCPKSLGGRIASSFPPILPGSPPQLELAICILYVKEILLSPPCSPSPLW